MRRLVHCLALAALLAGAGCCCLTSGTWEDDSGNWERAFKSTKPDDVKILHSKYWRSPHFTCEFSYYFEIAPNAKLEEQLFTENKLKPVTGPDAAKVMDNNWGDVPAWFAPKPVDAYDIYIYDDEPSDTGHTGNFKILIDKETGTMFLADHQV